MPGATIGRALAVTLLLAAGAASAHHVDNDDSQAVDYELAGFPFVFWCDDNPDRSYLPAFPSAPDPDSDASGLLTWLFGDVPDAVLTSEAACVGEQAGKDGHSHGVGGGVFCYGTSYEEHDPPRWECPDRIGYGAIVEADDMVGIPFIRITMSCYDGPNCVDERYEDSGCGTVYVGAVPDPGYDHYLQRADPIAWVTVAALHVDPDGLEICVGHRGTLTLGFVTPT